MTLVVGVAPGSKNRAALELAAALATVTPQPIVAVSVTPEPWRTPSMGKVDAEYIQWWDSKAASTQATVEETLAGFDVTFTHRTHHARSAALIEEARKASAAAIVIGSSRRGKRRKIDLGATANQLAHSSPVPIAVAPSGYRNPDRSLTRLTCAVSGRDDDASMVSGAVEVLGAVEVAVRLVTFGVRPHSMFPPEVGFDAEAEIFSTWRGQAGQTLTQLQSSLDIETTSEVAVGPRWRDAVESLDWTGQEILAVGSRTSGALSRVFLGDNASKIIRHTAVPVLVMPS